MSAGKAPPGRPESAGTPGGSEKPVQEPTDFIRAAVAHEIASLMRYRGMSVSEAADEVVMKQLVKLGGSGGVIAVGRDGSIAMPFNSPGMLRGAMDSAGRFETAILK